MTRTVVFDIAGSMIGLFGMLLAVGVTYWLDRMMNSASKTLDILEGMSHEIRELSKRGK